MTLCTFLYLSIALSLVRYGTFTSLSGLLQHLYHAVHPYKAVQRHTHAQKSRPHTNDDDRQTTHGIHALQQYQTSLLQLYNLIGIKGYCMLGTA